MRRTLYRYSRPFKEIIREGFLLRLRDGEREGWGEIAPLPGFSRESLDEAFEDFQKESYLLPSVQFGYQSALLDLRNPIDLPSIPIKIKCKVGHLSVEEALKEVARSPQMRIDFNRRWTLEDALSFARHFPDVEYFEEPLLPGERAEDFPYPVALDESLREGELPPYPNVVAHIIKPTMHGSPLPKIEKGIDFILSSSYETELGIYQIAKLSLRLKLPLKPMGLGTSHLFEEPLFEEEPYVENNILYFPKRWRLKMDKVQVLLDEII
ncbi:MAG: o-succinylbenzoate synthase [Chlamydiae bacterium]|nr:o-succinylbenzoate synthase [Chlamydiota bacterium]